MSFIKRCASLLILVLLLNSCERIFHIPDTREAHYVKYRVKYLEDMAGDVPTRILPSKMDAYYTNRFVLTSIEGFFNQFSLLQLADLRRKRVTTMLNFFGNKVYYRGKQGELPAGIKQPELLQLTFSGESSVIGGLHSEMVQIDTGAEQFDIYYTTDFSVKRPNIITPYQSINHPLSDFRIQLSLLKMHLTCTEYETRVVDSDIFTVPDDYRQVTKPEMEEIINSLFTKE